MVCARWLRCWCCGGYDSRVVNTMNAREWFLVGFVVGYVVLVSVGGVIGWFLLK